MLAAAAAIAGVAFAPAAPPPTTILKVRPGQLVRMHVRPGGRLLFRVLPKTVYGRRLILSVTHRRAAWAAVTTFLVPNGRRAWVRVERRTFAVRRTRWRLTADLSARTVTVLHGARRVRTLRVAIGAPATPTPPGTYAITDKLAGAPFGRAYGCCILALSGHQPKVRTGPIDGRLAIHGTDRPDLVGARVSQGCLRARDRDVRWLMRTVPVGTQLTIRR
jgi:lipoprotein-anchoring transpeptidase ErfK/SrfK